MAEMKIMQDGNPIGECTKRMFERLKNGAHIDDVIAQFIGELRLALATITGEELA